MGPTAALSACASCTVALLVVSVAEEGLLPATAHHNAHFSTRKLERSCIVISLGNLGEGADVAHLRNALEDASTQIAGMPLKAKKEIQVKLEAALEAAQSHRDDGVISHNAVMSACEGGQRWEEALGLVSRMRRSPLGSSSTRRSTSCRVRRPYLTFTYPTLP